MIRIYGIKQCSTMQKAFAWLDARNIAFEFHDYKKRGIDASTLRGWSARIGWAPLLNTRGTTWRKLPEEAREGLDEARAIALMQANTSVIKRPIVVAGDALLIGFDETRYEQNLKGSA